MKPNCAVLVLSAVLFALCLGQEEQKEQVITSEDKSAENRWPKTSVWLVSFDGREGTRLIVEAADLLASQDFGCTLVLVGPAANNPIKPSNKLIKSVYVEAKEVAAQTIAVKDDTAVLGQGEKDAHLAACEALLLESSLLAQLKSQPPKVIIFPGYFHDACILPLLSESTAAVVLSTGSVSSAWLGHATNTVPFSALRAPLQTATSSLFGRAMATLRWKTFLQDYEQSYWKIASQKVANRTERSPLNLDDAYKKVAFLASGSHSLLENPVPSMSLKVSVGCFHCRHANLLPEELQEWILPRKSGLIVITLPPSEDLISSLSILAKELPQYAFLWIGPLKLPESSDEIPANIVHHDKVTDQDALGHPRARLVLSECSEVLVLGSMFHGIPTVCVPQTWEEKLIAGRVEELGIGLIAITDPIKLSTAVKTIIENQNKFRGAARHLGVIIRDEPETASDRLTFWVGHTARHWGHGHDDILQEVRNSPRELFGLFDVGFILGAIMGVLVALLVWLLFILAQKQKGNTNAENRAESGKKKGKKGE